MAALPDADLTKLCAHLMRNPVPGEATAFTKPDLKAAAVAADAWFDGTVAALNTALPQPFRGAATQNQKAVLFALVVLRRGGVNHVDLRELFG